ncbi:hypothetical protein GOBAR_AA38437 [Gossypium barbadense]|uniref:Uncharacterized protein n=1 Tax=Gossypium barbadense TaxID=3634 RepID=A0A2P5VTX4_GOSBA|nr:hypothetical protein GOBAR_AA38437 [Gossypium barbadense]
MPVFASSILASMLKLVAKRMEALCLWLSKNIGKKVDKSALSNGSAMTKSTSAPSGVPTASLKVLRPDTSQMVIYDPRQHHGTTVPSNTTTAILAAPNLSNPMATVVGPAPNVDIVLSICLQNDYPTVQTKKATSLPSQRTAGPAPSTSDLSGSSKSHPIPSNSSFRPRDRQLGKRKDQDSKLLAITFLV